MKKKRIIIPAILLSILILLGIWIAEPLSYNPFRSTKMPLATSQLKSNCKATDQANNPLNQAIATKANSIMNRAIGLNDFIGVTAGISLNNCNTYVAGAGYQSKSGKIKTNPDMLHRIASISKPMTAVAIMQLFEKGKIDLDVPIQNYLYAYPEKSKGIVTIRQLLNHTAGVPHYESTCHAISFKNYSSLTAALDVFKDQPLAFEPGTNYLYSTYGYVILGAIIENVSELSYSDYMAQNIWSVAGMKNTSIEEKDKTYSNKSALYVKVKSQFIKAPFTDLSVKYSAGGIQSTAGDLLKFGAAILNHTLIKASTLEMMMTGTSDFKEGNPYGYGWFVLEDDQYGRILQHGGSQSGVSAIFSIYLDQKMVVSVLANSFGSDQEVYFLSRDLSELILDTANTKQVRNYIPQSKNEIKQYVGEYRSDKDILEITRKGNQLYAQQHPYPSLPVYPESDHEFFFRVFDGQLNFVKNAGQRSEKVIYTYKGKETEFFKIY